MSGVRFSCLGCGIRVTALVGGAGATPVLLDGGFSAWLADDFPLEKTEPPRPAPGSIAVDRLTDERFSWHLGRNYVRLEAGPRPAHILAVVAP